MERSEAGISGGSAGLEPGIRGLRIMNGIAAGSGVEPLPDGKPLRRIWPVNADSASPVREGYS